MIYKKAISPIISVALLMVVAVGSVVSFNSFFSDYFSEVISTTEIQTRESGTNTQIDAIFGTILYFKNGQSNNLTITAVKVNGVDCNVSQNAISNDLTQINISLCVSDLTTEMPEAVVYTDKGIYTKKFYVQDLIVS